MSQPNWKIIGQVGDINPVGYGGGWVLVDTTGVYDPELEYYEPDLECAYRFSLEQQAVSPSGFLLSARTYGNQAALPCPIDQYESWFSENLDQVASTIDLPVDELIKLLCSDDPMDLAAGYQALVMFYGWEEFDGYPLELTQDEAEARYSTWKITP